MDFLPDDLTEYIENHTIRPSKLLEKIDRETNAEVLMPRMLSGHLQGRFLSFLSKISSPGVILEIGTYTGYSALCLLEGLKSDGKIITIDINQELESRVRSYFNESGEADKINYLIGDALEIIPTIDDPIELVFIDADKINYSNYFDLVVDKVVSGGMIIVDNVLWSGKVVSSGRKKLDEDTEAIINFNKKVSADQRVENILLPVRDGLMLLRKI